jgi:aryl-alcohol dehydrogenase
VLNVLRPEPGSSVAVFGAGAVGMAALMAARLSGATRIIAVDLVDSRLELARELGATDAVNATDGGALEPIRQLTGGRGVSYCLECSGSTRAVQDAIAVLKPLGACALIGAPPAGSTVPVDVNYMLNGRRVVGVTEGDSNPEGFIPALVELWREGRFPIDRLMKNYAFEDLDQAARDAHSGAVIKAVLSYQ